MGFERAAIEFLLWAKGCGISMAHVLKIGSQGMHVRAEQLCEQRATHGKNLSPEPLFRVLSEANGFEVTHMILFEHPWKSTCYEVMDPEQARSRVELINTRPASLIACAKRMAEKPIFAAAPRQSDYPATWEKTSGPAIGVEHTASQPEKSRRGFVPPGAVRWYRIFQPFRSRLYKRAS